MILVGFLMLVNCSAEFIRDKFVVGFFYCEIKMVVKIGYVMKFVLFAG